MITVNKDNVIDYPFGLKPHGYLIYTPSGYVSVCVMSEDFYNLKDICCSTTENGITANEDNFIQYTGTFRITDNKIIHLPEVSFFPDWIGVSMERFYSLDGNILTLKTPFGIEKGEEKYYVLQWHRME